MVIYYNVVSIQNYDVKVYGMRLKSKFFLLSLSTFCEAVQRVRIRTCPLRRAEVPVPTFSSRTLVWTRRWKNNWIFSTRKSTPAKKMGWILVGFFSSIYLQIYSLNVKQKKYGSITFKYTWNVYITYNYIYIYDYEYNKMYTAREKLVVKIFPNIIHSWCVYKNLL